MVKLICPRCMKVHYNSHNGNCPDCKLSPPNVYDFKNSDEFLIKETQRVLDERKEYGLEGLVEGLDSIIINTENERQVTAVTEFLNNTGLVVSQIFKDKQYQTFVLKTKDSANILVKTRHKDDNPFLFFNKFIKSKHLPNTRLETFVFKTKNIEKYFEIQKSRGVNFLTNDIIHKNNFSFVQTIPSSFTGVSIGFIQWKRDIGNYISSEDEIIDLNIAKPKKDFLENIKELDHTATRVRAKDRDSAIIEFMNLTNYNFDFAVYVKLFNSITNVARLSKKDFAMVFTSGISQYVNDEMSGPTEKFIHNYGTRVHHLAFRTADIEDTFQSLKKDGQKFLIDLVGSHNEGLKQTFTTASENTLIVNEYIQRYGDFDGFFSKNNVTLLTKATDNQ